VQGLLDAPIGQVFATDAWFARNGGAEASLRAGTIRFTSRRMERVHPEWWGAEGGSRFGDNDALDAALRAALVDRGASVGALAPLDIELRATYQLTRPWALSGAASTPALTLRGAPGTEDVPTFVSAPSFSGAALVTVNNLESVVFEDVRFDGAGRVASCLALTTTRQNVMERPHLLRRCGFAGATEALVAARATASGDIAPMADDVGGARTLDLRVEGCRFQPDSMRQTALQVSTSPNLGVELEGCAFEGAAATMVHARGAGLSVVSCHFHNRVPEVVTTPEGDLHASGPEGDLDLFLDRDGNGPVASVFAQDCRSRSEQFLATVAGDPGVLCGDSTIVGLHHVRPRVEGVGVGVIEVPPPKRLPPIWTIFEPTPLAPGKVIDPKARLGDVNAQKPSAPPAPESIEPVLKGGTFTLPPGLKPNTGVTAFRPAGSGVAPIHWRVASSGARLALMGCRFDQLSGLAAVRAFAGCAPVADLGILGSPDPIRAVNPTIVQRIPLLSTD
jgi:hypothetical protein